MNHLQKYKFFKRQTSILRANSRFSYKNFFFGIIRLLRINNCGIHERGSFGFMNDLEPYLSHFYSKYFCKLIKFASMSGIMLHLSYPATTLELCCNCI